MTSLYQVFIYCGGKTGSKTLCSTFSNNDFLTIHTHSNENYMAIHDTSDNIFKLIDESSKNFENIYIIDSYRNPLERKISSFFHKIHKYLPNCESLSLDELVSYFNDNLLHTIEDYHPINEVLNHYYIPLWSSFDFNKKYNLTKHGNIHFIKILFKDIAIWDSLLSGIFGKNIIMHNNNLTIDKPTYNLYKSFLEVYKVPKKYLYVIKEDREFNIYNNREEKIDYFKKWAKKSF